MKRTYKFTQNNQYTKVSNQIKGNIPIARPNKKQELYNFEQHKKLLLKNRPSTQFLKDYRFSGLDSKLENSCDMILNQDVILDDYLDFGSVSTHLNVPPRR